MNKPPVHYYARVEGEVPRIGCGKAVAGHSEYSDSLENASCYRCARLTPGLSDVDRETIRENARFRIGRPMAKAKKKSRRGFASPSEAREP
jgi:hypothetical protein